MTGLITNYLASGTAASRPATPSISTGSCGIYFATDTLAASIYAAGSWNSFGGVSDGDKGDITVSGSGGTWTIDNGAVTLAKQANVATGTVFYRKTAGAGAPEVQTLATLKTDLGLTGTNSGDQTITLTGDVTGSGTGSFAATIANSAVTLAKMADMATGSLFYRKTAGSGAPEIQTLATLKTDLGLTGTNSGDQTITLTGDVTGSGTGSFAATIAASSVTLAKMADLATSTFIGRVTAGTGVPEALSGAQATSLLDIFTSGAKGLVPASGGGTTTFLRADGTFAAPASGSGTVTSVDLSAPAIFTVSGNPVTTTGTLTLTLASQTQNLFFASPNGSSGAPTFRSIVAADIPTLNQNTTGSAATLATARDIASSGDVVWTVSFNGSANVSAAATIQAGAVTLAKMANVVTGSVFYRKTGGDGAPEVQTLATLKTDLGLTGTNSGDQTSIVGITGTTAQFNTALTDNDFATLAGTETLTNKRVNPRVSTTASSATPTINTDNVDMFGLTALAVDITSFTTNLSGTPVNGQKLWIYIVGTATRAITWGASFEDSTVALPTATSGTDRLDVGFVWNAVSSKWRCVGVA